VTWKVRKIIVKTNSLDFQCFPIMTTLMFFLSNYER